MVHELDIIYNQVPGKVSTLNSSEIMADNVRAGGRGSSSALKTAEGNFDVDHQWCRVTLAFRARVAISGVCGTSTSQSLFSSRLIAETW